VSSNGRAETAGKCLARRACSAYLKRSLGTLVQGLVCNAGAACCSLRERGPVCFEPKRADEGLAGWLVHCESWTPSGQATSNASDDVGSSVCGSHRRRTPSSCAGQNYAAAWLQRKTHASTPVVSLRQMGCRGGRVASTMPIPPGPAYRFCTIGRLICCRPKWAWSVGMRHIGIASCAWCTSFAGRCRALVAPRRMRPWQTRSGTRHGGDSHRLANCQSSGSA
jgi:hypothetical protein